MASFTWPVTSFFINRDKFYMTGDQFYLSSDQFLMTILDIFLSILFFSMTSFILTNFRQVSYTPWPVFLLPVTSFTWSVASLKRWWPELITKPTGQAGHDQTGHKSHKTLLNGEYAFVSDKQPSSWGFHSLGYSHLLRVNLFVRKLICPYFRVIYPSKRMN